MEHSLKIFTSILFATSFLSGCAIYEEAFDCKAGKGMGCQSISQVNDMVDQGRLDEAIDGNAPKTELSESDHVTLENLPSFPNPPLQLTDSSIEGELIKRTNEETLRVWIAPFEDKSGDFQGESFVHTVIKPGKWITSDAYKWLPPEEETV